MKSGNIGAPSSSDAVCHQSILDVTGASCCSLSLFPSLCVHFLFALFIIGALSLPRLSCRQCASRDKEKDAGRNTHSQTFGEVKGRPSDQQQANSIDWPILPVWPQPLIVCQRVRVCVLPSFNGVKADDWLVPSRRRWQKLAAQPEHRQLKITTRWTARNDAIRR